MTFYLRYITIPYIIITVKTFALSQRFAKRNRPFYISLYQKLVFRTRTLIKKIISDAK